MHKVENNAADGPLPDDDAGASASPHRSRRKQILAVTGLVTLVGAGALAVTYQLNRDGRATSTAVGPLAAQTAPAHDSDPPPAVAASPGAAQPTVTAKSFEQRLSEARTAASRAGTTIRNPMPPAKGGPVAAADVSTTVSGDVRKDGHSLRVVSAHSDLTGQRELAWVADDGEKVGDARCSQTFKLSNNVTAKKHPTLLVCWRTSATRSVYTVAVDVKGHPSTETSVAALNETWAKLG